MERLSTQEKQGEVYDALLEAAISAARAVPWVLQREIAVNVPALLTWYEARAREMGLPRNSAVIWLRDARNLATEKESPSVDFSAHYRDIRVMEPPPGGAIAVTDRGEPGWITRDEQGREAFRPASGLDGNGAIRHRIIRPEPPSPLLLEGRDISGLDATAFLREYSEFLGRLVQAAESARV